MFTKHLSNISRDRSRGPIKMPKRYIIEYQDHEWSVSSSCHGRKRSGIIPHALYPRQPREFCTLSTLPRLFDCTCLATTATHNPAWLQFSMVSMSLAATSAKWPWRQSTRRVDSLVVSAPCRIPDGDPGEEAPSMTSLSPSRWIIQADDDFRTGQLGGSIALRDHHAMLYRQPMTMMDRDALTRTE